MESPQVLVDVMTYIWFERCYAFVIFAMVVYDWLIALDEEIHFVWGFRKGYKLNAAVLLYGLSRYSMIISELLALLAVFPMSDKACRINVALQVTAGVLYLPVPAIFSTIRVYVLLPTTRIMSIIVFLLLFMPLLATWVVENAVYEVGDLPKPIELCDLTPRSPSAQALKIRLSTATVICNIAGDIIVLLVTWYKMYTTYRAQRRVPKCASLIRVILYDGSMYFIVITGANVINLILQAATVLSNPNIAATVTIPLTTVLICHFLLELQRAAGHKAHMPTSPSLLSSLDFATATPRNAATGTLPAFIASIASDVQSTGLGGHVDSEGVPRRSEGRTGSDIELRPRARVGGGSGDGDEIARGDERDWGVWSRNAE